MPRPLIWALIGVCSGVLIWACAALVASAGESCSASGRHLLIVGKVVECVH
jgi:hypothetical protein